MENFHKACKDCILNNDCLFQSICDVETCSDVQDYEMKENTEDKMSKFTILYIDGTQFSGNGFKRDWDKILDTKQIVKLVYLLGDQCIVMEGFKQYNHCIEKVGLQAKGICKVLLMGRREKDTLIITFDLIKKKIFQKMSKHGEEYGKQILNGWKKGKLKDPKAYFKKLDNKKG